MSEPTVTRTETYEKIIADLSNPERVKTETGEVEMASLAARMKAAEFLEKRDPANFGFPVMRRINADAGVRQ